jgi:hypothetical protein
MIQSCQKGNSDIVLLGSWYISTAGHAELCSVRSSLCSILHHAMRFISAARMTYTADLLLQLKLLLCMLHMLLYLLCLPAVKRCSGLPTALTPALSTGWSDSCSNATHGTVCSAACIGNATGGYSSTCFEGNWTTSATSCQREPWLGQDCSADAATTAPLCLAWANRLPMPRCCTLGLHMHLAV